MVGVVVPEIVVVLVGVGERVHVCVGDVEGVEE